jgi:hypothetical protein
MTLTLRQPCAPPCCHLGRCIDAQGRYPTPLGRASVPPDPTAGQATPDVRFPLMTGGKADILQGRIRAKSGLSTIAFFNTFNGSLPSPLQIAWASTFASSASSRRLCRFRVMFQAGACFVRTRGGRSESFMCRTLSRAPWPARRPRASLMLLRVGSEPGLELAHHRHQARHFGNRIEQRP